MSIYYIGNSLSPMFLFHPPPPQNFCSRGGIKTPSSEILKVKVFEPSSSYTSHKYICSSKQLHKCRIQILISSDINIFCTGIEFYGALNKYHNIPLPSRTHVQNTVCFSEQILFRIKISAYIPTKYICNCWSGEYYFSFDWVPFINISY